MLQVVHHPDYIVTAEGGAHSFSKYAAVMAALRAEGDLVEHLPEAMPRAWVERAHDPGYVSQVLSAQVPAAIERRIGFAIPPAIARRSLLSAGGTYLAAKLAIEHGYAANSAGGSHHALADTGAGFCVFNDLAIATLRLLKEGAMRRVLIVDCDVHQGDGTAAILDGREGVTTLSIHAEKNFPVRKRQSTLDVALPDGIGDDEYLQALTPALEAMIDRARPDLVLYQAGIDVHRDDKLGRLALSDDGIAERDQLVAERASRLGVPLASALGGGYGNDIMMVARRHATTMRTLNAAYRR